MSATMRAYFERFFLDLPVEVVGDCSHSGSCDQDVAFWAKRVPRPAEITPEKLAAELREYGAWTPEELADDADNWHRLIWCAACNIKEDQREELQRLQSEEE